MLKLHEWNYPGFSRRHSLTTDPLSFSSYNFQSQASFIWEGFVGEKRKGNDAIIFQFKNITYMLIHLSGFEIPQVARCTVFGKFLVKSLDSKMGSW